MNEDKHIEHARTRAPRPHNAHLFPSNRINREIQHDEGFQVDTTQRTPNYFRIVPDNTKKPR